MPSAHVTSIEAILRLKAAVQAFGDSATDALAALAMEIQRVVDWVQHDRVAYWQQRVQKSWDAVAEARSNLERCQMFTVAGHRPACRDEQEALYKAQRDLRYAEEKVDVVKKWCRTLDHEITEYEARTGQLASWLEGDLPKAEALLGRMIASLEAYAATTAPSADSLTQEVESMARSVSPPADEPSEPSPPAGEPDAVPRPAESPPQPTHP